VNDQNEFLWYVVHTYSGYENKVSTNINKIVENRNLSHLIGQVVVPVEKVVDVSDKAEKEVEHKLFPGYVLVKMIMTDESWHVVRNTRGVTGFVGPGSKPIPLTDAEVEALGVEVRTYILNFGVGDSVKICSGPLSGYVAVVDYISEDRRKIKVVASMFGREMALELDSADVETVME